MGGFNLKEAFPDLNPRFHHFRLDPLDAGRVWFTSQASGTDKGSGFLGNQPTGKSFSTPPQACSLKFDEAVRSCSSSSLAFHRLLPPSLTFSHLAPPLRAS